MKPNPNTLDYLNAVLALLNSPIEPQQSAIDKYLADVECKKPDLFKDESNGTNQNNQA